MRFTKAFIIVVFLFFQLACATYFQKQYQFQQDFAAGNMEQAQSFLEQNTKAAEKKDRLLYFLDRGVVEQMLGNYEISNSYFEKAYVFSQDYRRDFGQDFLSITVNPMLTTYRGEDYEIVLLHFYKAMNYLQLGQFDEALIEVRRINIKLNELNDKYALRKNRYKEDAFAHNLMGLIYEAKGNYNDAFIAYRNALEIYQSIYKEEFSLEAPLQLKKDILRMAAFNNFRQELALYEEEFSMDYVEEKKDGHLVFFWMNGLGPVKSELSINLFLNKGDGGGLVFANEQEHLTIPYTVNSSYYNTDPNEFSDLKFVRLALPKFKRRTPLARETKLLINNRQYELEKVEDVEQIAVTTLEDRMWREMAQSIGRLALKQAAEMAAREKDENLGSVVSMLGAFTEKADTRNWQTLPHSIYYQKIPLNEGEHKLELISSYSDGKQDTLSYQFSISKGISSFKSFHTLSSSPPINN